MAHYPKLAGILRKSKLDSFDDNTVPYLIEVWLGEYWKKAEQADVVATSHDRD